ncbi:hypothetical protein [Streptomyces sp. NBC_01477]|uniref:hypothetical protein n=1 Tax=Streptomyces sp. NBC_01477 TaxID=2976015 RepID=UPI002E3426A1|nr:hypothetical protein [Streptomyces sp. NBC_01477]
MASAVGAGRAHAAALLTGLLASSLLGAAGTGVVAAISSAHSDDMSTGVPRGAAIVAGLAAAAVSVLLGAAVGAVTNPPLLRSGGWSFLVTGSRTGSVHYPLLGLAVSALLAAAAALLSTRAASHMA